MVELSHLSSILYYNTFLNVTIISHKNNEFILLLYYLYVLDNQI